MVLIDTSSWIEAMRKDGDAAVRARVVGLMEAGEAGWCDMVRLELWNGARGVAERRHLEQLESDISLLPMTVDAWDRCCDLAKRARAKGLTVPGADLVIAGCAWEYGVAIEHDDAHLKLLADLFTD